MKRGLVLLDPREIPAGSLEERTSRLQSSIRQQGVAAALSFGDVYRSGDISYLSNICIYWNEAVLAVPAKGEPALLTKLSSRVHPWMRAISNLRDLRSGPNLADLADGYLKNTSPGVLGLVEMDWWPAPLVNELQAKLPGWELRDLGSVVRVERQRPADSERKLLRESAEISARAVAIGVERTMTNPERAGQAELAARMAGVEDVMAFCHPATDHADTVEVLAEYRGYWALAARVAFKGSTQPHWAPMLRNAYASAERVLRPGVDVAQLRLAAGAALTDRSIAWRIDLIHHTDLETRGDYRLPGEQAAPVEAGSVVGMRLELTFSDGSQAVTADTFEFHEDGVRRLTKPLSPVLVQS